MVKQIFTLIIVYFALNTSSIFAQQSSAEIIKNAIRDELARNMDSIANSSCGKPFFISYMVREAKVMSVSASLGAITRSLIQPSLSNTSRLILGDYHITDENFNYRKNERFQFQQNISFPREPDYWGIRRALWASAERMYGNACKSYQAKKMLLDENGITNDKYVLSDFSKAPAVELDIQADTVDFDQEYWEDVARKISAIFVDYPEITSSNVVITILGSTVHFINSEGTEVSYPITNASISIMAALQDEKFGNISEMFWFSVNNEKELPSITNLKESCHRLIEILEQRSEQKKLEEEYNGPVLFEGNSAAEMIVNTFFMPNRLIAQRQVLNSNAFEFRLPDKSLQNSLESKINKVIVSENISIKSLSQIEEYNGVKLNGNFYVDAEGVVPPKELILVENGKLLTLLNDRIPTFEVKESNGHNRLNIYRGKSIYPGVVHFTSTQNLSKNELKVKLLSMAKENGNTFAFIVRKEPYFNSDFVYKVDVETGSELLLKVGRIGQRQVKDFVKDVYFSNDEFVANLGGSNMYRMPVSVICPKTILFEEIKISPAMPDRKLKKPAIKGPLF